MNEDADVASPWSSLSWHNGAQDIRKRRTCSRVDRQQRSFCDVADQQLTPLHEGAFYHQSQCPNNSDDYSRDLSFSLGLISAVSRDSSVESYVRQPIMQRFVDNNEN